MSLVGLQIALNEVTVFGLGELVLVAGLAAKYEASGGSSLHSDTLMWSLQQAEQMIRRDMQEELRQLKCLIGSLEPSGSGICEKLQCMEQLRKGDFRDLMRFKQSLSYSSPVDLLFDLFTDLYRLSASDPACSNQQQLVLHKLTSPAVQDLLTPNLLQAMRDFVPDNCLYPFLLMLAAVVTPQLRDLFLQTMLDYLAFLRERLRQANALPPHVDDGQLLDQSRRSLADILN